MVMRSCALKPSPSERSEARNVRERPRNKWSVRPAIVSHCEISSCRGSINSTLRPSRTSKFPFSTNWTLPEFADLPVRFGIVPANVKKLANLKPF